MTVSDSQAGFSNDRTQDSRSTAVGGFDVGLALFDSAYSRPADVGKQGSENEGAKGLARSVSDAFAGGRDKAMFGTKAGEQLDAQALAAVKDKAGDKKGDAGKEAPTEVAKETPKEVLPEVAKEVQQDPQAPAAAAASAKSADQAAQQEQLAQATKYIAPAEVNVSRDQQTGYINFAAWSSDNDRKAA